MDKRKLKKYFLETKLIPLHQLGQNFLLNKKITNKIIEAARLSKKDAVLEIGPGAGQITGYLAQRAGKVIAVEKDKNLASLVQKQFKKSKNVDVLHADALAIEPVRYGLLPFKYKIIANLPYSITGAFFRKFLNSKTIPAEMVLMVQKEVGQRLLAKKPPFSILAITANFYGSASLITAANKEDFWPKPKVSSVVLKIDSQPDASKLKIEKIFFEILRAGFAQKRKTLANSLQHNLKLEKNMILELLEQANIEKNARAEQLFLAQWITLATLASKAKI